MSKAELQPSILSPALVKTMHHDAAQLNKIWDALKSGDALRKADVLRPYANPKMPDVLPVVVCADEHAEVLSIPTPDHAGRHVYGRKPGGEWSELH